MSRTITSVAGVLAFLLAASCSTGPAAETHSAPMISGQSAEAAATPARDPTVAKIAAMNYDVPFTKYTLKNGLTLIVHEDNKTPTVTVHIVYHVGSKNEP